MPNMTEYLHQVQKLTNRNLEILRALNESFYTKKHHLAVVIDDEKYVIPSYIALENKVNTLQANFENLVNAPSTGEAYMNFGGNTQKIQLQGYSQTPHRTNLKQVNTFNVNSNDIFKDFITPNAYVRLLLHTIDNSTKTVNVKKISLRSDAIKQRFSDLVGEISYGRVREILYDFEEDVDYFEYDTLRRLPLRDQNAQGEYIINEIRSNSFNDNFLERYTLKLDTLSYWIDSGTIERQIQVGDELVTNTDNVKMVVTAVRNIINEIDVEILNNGYANLGDVSTQVEDMYKLHYFRSVDFDATKYIDVPLEEDKCILLFVAPVNDTTNIQAPFGTGLVIDTSLLTISYDGTIYNFDEFYNLFVNNLGDTLFGITSMIDNTINNVTEAELTELMEANPVLDKEEMTVTQINKHLNDSESIKNIRKLYTQKSTSKSNLNTIQLEIDNINTQLATLDFDDTTNSRELFVNRLADLNEQKDNLVSSISSIIQEISQNVNESDVPIENAKYHIRGFVNVQDAGRKVIKVDVQYRYKNKNKFTGNAESIGDNIYSDWNEMRSDYNVKLPHLHGNKYIFDYEEDLNNQNQISWNQLDIPITQGETVDIRVRYVYDYCYPFAECRSDWSDIINIEFPEEYLKDVTVLDIINENNDDVKKEQFNGILKKEGILEHVSDSVTDQNSKYHHKTENIASGFFTPERRVIPLFDKLKSIDDVVGILQSEVMGSTSENIQVTLYDNEHSQLISPFSENLFNIKDYQTSSAEGVKVFNFGTNVSLNLTYSQITIDIYNSGIKNMKLYTSFPGNIANNLVNNIYGTNGCLSDSYSKGAGYFINWKTSSNTSKPQKYNQWVYFRRYDVFDGETTGSFYERNPNNNSDLLAYGSNNGKGAVIEASTSDYNFNTAPDNFMTIFPIDSNQTGNNNNSSEMSCQCNSGEKYIVIKPGEHRQILVGVWFCVNSNNISKREVRRSISFDLRTSLFQDPINYKFTVRATKTPELTTKIQRIQAQKVASETLTPYKAVVLNN